MNSQRAKYTIWISAVLVAVAMLFLARAASEGEDDAMWVATAQGALQPFKQRLMAALKEGLAKGPEAAIDACRLEAPRIANEVASETIRVGRTSHRLRNSGNAPRPWMLPILDELRDAEPGLPAYRTARIDAAWVGYAEPIYMKPLCLTCHGKDLPQPLSDRVHAMYPQDQATGFAAGEFRGIFWVELKTSAAIAR